MKKVLVITYYWPPAGGAGIQRTVKFVKYMQKYGWEPVILTVSNGEYQAIDETFIAEIPHNIKVYKTTAIQPFKLYKWFTGKKKDVNLTNEVFSQKNKRDGIAKWVRMNLFIPDARVGWYFTAVKAAKRIIEQEHIDLIYSSSPPHSLQLIAKKAAKKSGLKWVADFRDPWSELVYYQTNKRSWLTRKIDGYFEKSVFRAADQLITAAHDYAKCIKKHVNREIEVIYNGYDPCDFPGVPPKQKPDFLITYTGELSKDRIPYALLRALNRLKNTNLKLQFVGNICQEVHEEVERLNLLDKVVFKPYLPHAASIAELQNSDLLLLVIDQIPSRKGIVPGKLFEYLGTHKPILCLGDPSGESCEIIRNTNSGFCIAHDREEEIFHLLSELSTGTLPDLTFEIEQFERENETRQLCRIFDSLLNPSS